MISDAERTCAAGADGPARRAAEADGLRLRASGVDVQRTAGDRDEEHARRRVAADVGAPVERDGREPRAVPPAHEGPPRGGGARRECVAGASVRARLPLRADAREGIVRPRLHGPAARRQPARRREGARQGGRAQEGPRAARAGRAQPARGSARPPVRPALRVRAAHAQQPAAARRPRGRRRPLPHDPKAARLSLLGAGGALLHRSSGILVLSH